MADEHLDLTSEPQTRRQQGNDSPRDFLGVQFACCSVYTRIYVNREAAAYVGNCPRCGKPVRIGIGEGGTSSRFFRVS